MEKICGFNVSSRKHFKLTTNERINLRQYYESTNLKNHIVRIFPADKYYPYAMKYIYNKDGRALFAAENKDVVMFTKEGSVNLIKSGKLLKKVTDVLKKI